MPPGVGSCGRRCSGTRLGRRRHPASSGPGPVEGDADRGGDRRGGDRRGGDRRGGDRRGGCPRSRSGPGGGATGRRGHGRPGVEAPGPDRCRSAVPAAAAENLLRDAKRHAEGDGDDDGANRPAYEAPHRRHPSTPVHPRPALPAAIVATDGRPTAGHRGYGLDPKAFVCKHWPSCARTSSPPPCFLPDGERHIALADTPPEPKGQGVSSWADAGRQVQAETADVDVT